MTTTPFAEALSYVTDQADVSDLDRLLEAIKRRRRALQAVRAAAVRVGSTVTLDDISPKYLIGLTGAVTTIERNRATVTLDANSTARLRYSGRRRFYVPADADAFPLTGVPLSCCLLSEESA